MISFVVNNSYVQFDGDPDTPLLWALRDHLKLTGTKYGCGVGVCGSCTVHIDGKARRSCTTPVSSLQGRSVLTIEGLAGDGGKLHPVQQAWLDEDVPQCGYCHGGMIMQTVELLQHHPNPSDADIDANLENLCRCGTYVRIRKAIHKAAKLTLEEK